MDEWTWTNDPLHVKQVLWPTELHPHIIFTRRLRNGGIISQIEAIVKVYIRECMIFTFCSQHSAKKKHPAENNCGVPENAYYTLSTKLKVAMP